MKDLAKYAVNNRAILLKNRDPFTAFTEIFDTLSDGQKTALRPQLARLYLQNFKAPAKENGKLATMKALALFVGVKDDWYYLHYVYVNADRIGVASDGSTLLLTNRPLNLEPGFYDPKTGVLAHDPSYARFPDFGRVFNEVKQTGKPANTDAPEEIMPVAQTGAKPYQIVKIGGHWYQQSYINRVKRVIPHGDAVISAKGTLMIADETYTTIVMPYKAPE